MPKTRIFSFIFFGIVLLIFTTVIPTRLWHQAPIPMAEQKTLQVEDSVPNYPSDVIAVCIPMQMQESEVPEDGRLTMADVGSAIGTNATQNSAQNSEETTSYVPDSGDGVSTQPQPEVFPENTPDGAPSSEDVPGAYPESHFLNGHPETSASDPETSALSGSHSGASTMYTSVSMETLETDDHFFSEDFLQESPMVSKNYVASDPKIRKVSRKAGLDIIPTQSGINGRSIYGPREHIIEDGDTLPRISMRYFGTTNREDEIFEKNRNVLSSKEELPIGKILLIPDPY